MPVFFTRTRLKSKVGGRLRGAGGDLYDIRRGSAAFGRFVGAGRRLSGGSWELGGAFGRFLVGLKQPSPVSFGQMGS